MRSALQIEVVRNQLTDARTEQILQYWTERNLLAGQAAQARLPEVVCVLLDGDDLVGINSVYDEAVPLIGGRRFYVYRRSLDPEPLAQGHDVTLFNQAFDVLDAEHEKGVGPVGLAVVIDDVEMMRARPEAVWADTQLMYAGYLQGDRQLRIRYFTDADIG